MKKESSEDFYVRHFDILQPLEHQVVAPKMCDYADVDSYQTAYAAVIHALDELEQFCLSQKGGKQWFDETYNHCFNSRISDFSLANQIRAGYDDLLARYADYQKEFEEREAKRIFLSKNDTAIRNKIIEIVTQNPGILQKDIYKHFEQEYKFAVIDILQRLYKEKILFRTHYKNTFNVFLNS